MVGVFSYLLISFWFTRIAATKSAIQAIVTNKVGDFGMSIALFAIIFVFGNLDYSNIFSLAPYINTDILTFISLCLLVGVCAKSSQLGRIKTEPNNVLILNKNKYNQVNKKINPARAILRYGPWDEKKSFNAFSRKFSSYSRSNDISKDIIKLNPFFVTGYADAESSFLIKPRPKKTGFFFSFNLEFSICAKISPQNLHLFESFKEFFGHGSISKTANMYRIVIKSKEGLKIVREHFETYPLQTSKQVHFLLWCKVMDILKESKVNPKSEELFHKILSIKAAFPRGLNENIKVIYPDIIPEQLPLKIINDPLDPYWIAGFVNGDGSFMLHKNKKQNKSGGFSYILRHTFSVTQHIKDVELLHRIKDTLGCGKVIPPYSARERTDLRVTLLADIKDKILPFFKEYQIYGTKRLDFYDFCKGIEIMSTKSHLTPGGKEEFLKIIEGMNSFREF